MQVVCSSCQLNFQAPEGATGLVCPICRSPLRPAQAAAEAASKNVLEWAGGSLDDLIAILTGPALSVRVEVLPAQGDTPAGEVHLLAGGVSEAIFAGKSTYDAIDKLRAVTPARFRIEPRLPNPTDGDLTYPGNDSGTLDSRPLAHLMRYCEQYVITCAIEVWRGSETARVDYRKGEIGGVTVGGIDAPERLAEVMQWAAGNYRLIVPRLTLPETAPQQPAGAAPRAAAAAPAPAPARTPSGTHATRTIFGMPALDLASMKAAEVAAAAARAQPQAAAPAAAPSPPPAQPRTSVSGMTAVPAPAGIPVTPPGLAHLPVPPPIAAPERQNAATKTMFGVTAPPAVAEALKPAPEVQRSMRATVVGQAVPESPPATGGSVPSKADRKTGARKTAVPAPEVIPPAAGAAPPPAAAAAASDTGRAMQPSPAPSPAAAAPEPVLARPAPAAPEDRTQPVRVAAKKSRSGSIWTYVGVGFLFGLALLGIYQLVGVLAH